MQIFFNYKTILTVLGLNVEKDDPDFVLDGNGLVQKDRDNVSHVVTDPLALGIGAHGQILLNLTKLVYIALERNG